MLLSLINFNVAQIVLKSLFALLLPPPINQNMSLSDICQLLLNADHSIVF